MYSTGRTIHVALLCDFAMQVNSKELLSQLECVLLMCKVWIVVTCDVNFEGTLYTFAV